MLASASSAVACTYRMFARQQLATGEAAQPATDSANEAGGAGHVEFLVDRFGRLRSRTIGIPPAQREDEVLAQVEVLARETDAQPALWSHRH
jgi:hypothetical protein